MSIFTEIVPRFQVKACRHSCQGSRRRCPGRLGVMVKRNAILSLAHSQQPAHPYHKMQPWPASQGPGPDQGSAEWLLPRASMATPITSPRRPGAQGPGSLGPGAQGPGSPRAQGPGTIGPGAQGPGTLSPGAQGPRTLGPGAQRLGTSQDPWSQSPTSRILRSRDPWSRSTRSWDPWSWSPRSQVIVYLYLYLYYSLY